MFEQVCSEKIKRIILEGNPLPDDQSARMKLLSKSWSIRPMSYKQFSNLVSKQNSFYKSLVAKNGTIDPLNKTLIIIDEAHKLYGGNDLSSLERPNMEELHKALMSSYMISGDNSARLLLMTATPITQDPMELIKIVNLCKLPTEQMPTTFSEFSAHYLDENGLFTAEGKRRYLNDISGYISYLNREKDARQFSQPILKQVLVPLVRGTTGELIKKYDKPENVPVENLQEVKLLEEQLNQELKVLEKWDGIGKDQFKQLLNKCDDFEGKERKECTKVIKAQIAEIVKHAKLESLKIKENIKTIKEEIKNTKLTKKDELKNVRNNIKTETKEYAKFKETLYSNLKNVCGKKMKDLTNIKNVAEELPEIVEINNLIRELDESIARIHDDYKIKVVSMKNHLQSLRELLKQPGLVATQKTELKQQIVEKDTETKKEIKTEQQYVKRMTEQMKKTKKKYELAKNKMLLNVGKTYKNKLKIELSEEKKAKMEEKKAIKLKLKTGEINVENVNNEIKEILAEKNQQISSILEELKETKKANDVKRRQEEAVKEAEKRDKEIIKENKENAKRELAEQKQRQKELAIRDKEIAKEKKDKEREVLRRQKEAVKEAEARDKKRIQELKATQKEQKAKLNKTAKNKPV
jgi:hypothetical protein